MYIGPFNEAFISHKSSTNEFLATAGISHTKVVATPLSLNLKLSATDGPPYADPSHYRCLVGKLNFLTHTRPDLAYSVHHLSQFLQAPRVSHFEALEHVLKYIATILG